MRWPTHHLLKRKLLHALVTRHEIAKVRGPLVESGALRGSILGADRAAQLDEPDLQFSEEARHLCLTCLALADLDEVAALHVKLLGAPVSVVPGGDVLCEAAHLAIRHELRAARACE